MMGFGRTSGGRTWPLFVLVFALAGCARSTTSYVHPNVDLGYVRRCAILPFQNLSQDTFADERLQSLFLMRVLQAGSLEVVEPGAVIAAMNTMRLPFGTMLSPEQYVALGKELGVDGIFFGSVQEFGITRENRQQTSRITAVFGLVETQTGVTVWQSQVHLSGTSLLRRLFGGGSKSMHEVSRSAVSRALRTLL